MDKKQSTGLSFCSILTLIFITLKLCNIIHWSWWWVLSPLWLGAIFTILLCVILFILATME